MLLLRSTLGSVVLGLCFVWCSRFTLVLSPSGAGLLPLLLLAFHPQGVLNLFFSRPEFEAQKIREHFDNSIRFYASSWKINSKGRRPSAPIHKGFLQFIPVWTHQLRMSGSEPVCHFFSYCSSEPRRQSWMVNFFLQGFSCHFLIY